MKPVELKLEKILEDYRVGRASHRATMGALTKLINAQKEMGRKKGISEGATVVFCWRGPMDKEVLAAAIRDLAQKKKGGKS